MKLSNFFFIVLTSLNLFLYRKGQYSGKLSNYVPINSSKSQAGYNSYFPLSSTTIAWSSHTQNRNNISLEIWPSPSHARWSWPLDRSLWSPLASFLFLLSSSCLCIKISSILIRGTYPIVHKNSGFQIHSSTNPSIHLFLHPLIFFIKKISIHRPGETCWSIPTKNSSGRADSRGMLLHQSKWIWLQIMCLSGRWQSLSYLPWPCRLCSLLCMKTGPLRCLWKRTCRGIANLQARRRSRFPRHGSIRLLHFNMGHLRSCPPLCPRLPRDCCNPFQH